MNRLIIALLLTLSMAGTAAAHGNISKLPDSVQILQYKMKLYMNADDAATKNNLAMAYFRTGQFDEAIKQLDEVLAKDGNNFNALDGMGVVLIKQGKGKEALEYLSRAETVNGKDLLLHVHLSQAYSLAGQKDKADAELAKAKSLAAGSKEQLAQIDQELKLLQ
jgi:Flp pilus assembly protein TadD